MEQLTPNLAKMARMGEEATEQAFLFADLAGFTALTEAHGDEEAADLALFVELERSLLRESLRDPDRSADRCERQQEESGEESHQVSKETKL